MKPGKDDMKELPRQTNGVLGGEWAYKTSQSRDVPGTIDSSVGEPQAQSGSHNNNPSTAQRLTVPHELLLKERQQQMAGQTTLQDMALNSEVPTSVYRGQSAVMAPNMSNDPARLQNNYLLQQNMSLTSILGESQQEESPLRQIAIRNAFPPAVGQVPQSYPPILYSTASSRNGLASAPAYLNHDSTRLNPCLQRTGRHHPLRRESLPTGDFPFNRHVAPNTDGVGGQIKAKGHQETMEKEDDRRTISEKLLGIPKPKRALTAYNFFFKLERQRMMDELEPAPTDRCPEVAPPRIPFQIMGKEIGFRWKSLTEEEKKPYVERAISDKSRYAKEMEVYKAKRESIMSSHHRSQLSSLHDSVVSEYFGDDDEDTVSKNKRRNSATRGK